MPKSALIFFLFAGLLALMNCGNECPEMDEDLGSLNIQTDSFDFFPYSGQEVLTFEDSTGTTKVFRPFDGLNVLNGRITVELVCTNNLFDNNSVFYSYERFEVGFESENDFFYIDLSIGSYVEDGAVSYDTILYDFFNMSGFIDNNAQMKDLSIIVDERGNSERIASKHRESVERFTFITDTTILGQNFVDVYKNQNSTYAYVFEPKKGIVAVIDDGNPFLLKD